MDISSVDTVTRSEDAGETRQGHRRKERTRWVAAIAHATARPDTGAGSYELHPLFDPREPAIDILKHGADVEVLAPRDLRDELASQLQRGANQYLKRKKVI